MGNDKDFYIVEASALPDVILKVMHAKKLMENGRHKTVQAAAMEAGISRSAFYKYRDLVFPFYENTRGKTVTLAMNLENVRGVLSVVLNSIADFGLNILTINQNIPINDIANVTITIEAGENSVADLIESLQNIQGMQSLKIIARE